MMRKKIVAGNWKMNKTLREGVALFKELLTLSHQEIKADKIIVAAPFIHLATLAEMAKNSNVSIAAQNISFRQSGAFTGEISAEMVKSTGAEYVIVGHSERRLYFHESPEELSLKVKLALSEGLSPIFCCGESLNERERENHFQTIAEQIESSLFSFEKEDLQNIIIAYEPVWAIGTGLTASKEQAQQMHAYIRSLLSDRFGNDLAQSMSILYGGSCNAQNAKELFSQDDVDGGLIGGASLNSNDFFTIINSF
jgi:triosephosphate isomerase (TIM)